MPPLDPRRLGEFVPRLEPDSIEDKVGAVDGTIHDADLVIYAIGIKPRDELAQASGIECHPRGGIVVDDNLQTSASDVYAIGECASWKGNYYGLIAPGSRFFLSLSRLDSGIRS